MNCGRCWIVLLVLGLSLTPCKGVTYYCPNAYDYTRHDPYADGIRVNTRTSLTFQVKGRNDAHVLLQNDRNNYRTNVIEIVIGGWGNSQSVIRNSQQGTNRVSYSGSVLSSSSYRWFWISWGGGCVQVGKGSSIGSSRIMNWCSSIPTMNGVRFSFGFGSDGYFLFERAVNGGWSNWGSYSSCPVTCGTGSVTRSRSCNNPTPAHGGTTCSGSATETGTCTKSACPKTCAEVYSSASSPPSSGTYTLANAQGQSFRVYCLFKSGYGYAFISNTINVDPNLAQLFTQKTEVLIRHKRTNGQQYDATAAQITRYSSKNLGVLYNSYSGYNQMQNGHMTPYLYVGFVPKSGVSHYHDTQGWRVQGRDYTFQNCDGNPNSYFTLLYNSQRKAYGSYTHGKTDLLHVWYDYATATSTADYIPDEYFASQFEIHFGGCGGYQTSTSFSGVAGASIGLKFILSCGTPATITSGSRSLTGTNPGDTVTYSCNAGYTITSGSASRTCSGGVWSGSQPTCGDINECASNPCKNGAQCVNGQNSFTCNCASGWTGTTCTADVNECASNPCKNGAACVNGANRYTCTCTAGWSGTNCDTDVNECASNPCKNGAQCTNGRNQFTCTCASGWTGTTCTTDVNECASSPCKNGATCNNLQNRYTCTCTGGWQGTNCDQDVNECASNPCKNGATCTNGRNMYTCTCAAGWQGTNCDQDIDECASNPCQNGATCHNQQNQYTCECAGGWTGTHCDQDIDECASDPCKNGAACTNGQNRFTCTCTGGWTGTDCNTDVNECASNPCKNGATCHNGRNEYSCTCTGGWQGYNCDEDINECLSDPCKNGATCNNLQNMYTCTCTGGWQGTDCDVDIDECASNPCQNGATCLNNQNNYECECVPGWQGVNCDTDIDECASNPCHNGAACNNLLNEYTCDCTPGWQGYDCDQDIDECLSSPCINGTCTNLHNAYRCTCFPQYTARNCDYLIGSPMDGQWGQWEAWQGCSVTCGTGRQRRYRACDDPPPDYGGQPCVGDSFDENVCSGAGSCPVPVDGNWGAWSVAAPCSVTCGTGHSVRTRNCDNPAQLWESVHWGCLVVDTVFQWACPASGRNELGLFQLGANYDE
ncbi:neurogenic locus notch homolog protein 2-like [Ruditapes philippinarum]|uniref:neurogenic locus notch homolog protein 2-like n=1 Tax=Ruditapes philippinarum TaxID=129788 RepID=UPI00295A9AD7|nr:neurogenic locus notch homolog protein 2-like [Ruditapes philippinarum]